MKKILWFCGITLWYNQNMKKVIVGMKIELDILRLGSNGEGVAKLQLAEDADGKTFFTVFVPGALPEERVLARVTQVKKSYAVAQLMKIIHSSEDRVQPACQIYAGCGGCQLQHYAYASQLLVKRQQVQDALERIGHLHCEVLPVLGMDSPWRYRNKMQFPVQGNKGVLEIGCYALKTHGVVNTCDCLIQEGGNNQVAGAVRCWMQEFNIPAYDERTGNGLVRHVMGRTGAGGEVLAVVVCTKIQVPHSAELVRILREQVPGLTGVVINVNPKSTNIIMGQDCHTLWGRDYLLDRLGELQFRVSPLSFFQVNRFQAEVLYNLVLELSGLSGRENVADVYCGTGTISLFLAGRARKVFGIEIVAEAISDARENALYNHINNAEFLVGDAAEELPRLLSKGFRPDVVVVDPPRAGCEEKVLQSIMAVSPKRIVYVSCNPATLARDLGILCNKYDIIRVQPVDMFPQTTHVETVVGCGLGRQG